MGELEDYPVGSVVLTPRGRRAIVRRHLTGASKKDCFTRLICQYEGGGSKDLVTLQPHQLRHAGSTFGSGQMSRKKEDGIHTYGYEAEQILALENA